MSTAGTSDRHLCCCLSFSGGNQSDMCDFQVKFQHVSTNYFMSDCRLLSGKKKGKGKGRGRGGKGKGKGRWLGKGRGRGCGQMSSDVPVSENSAARAVRRRLSFNDDEPVGSAKTGPVRTEEAQESARGDDQNKQDDSEVEVAETQGPCPTEVENCPGAERMNVDETADDDDDDDDAARDLQQVPASQPDEHHAVAGHNSEQAEVVEHQTLTAENLALASQPVAEEAHADAARPAGTGAAKASTIRGPQVNRTPDDLALITPPCCSIHLNCILAVLRYTAFLTQIGL